MYISVHLPQGGAITDYYDFLLDIQLTSDYPTIYMHGTEIRGLTVCETYLYNAFYMVYYVCMLWYLLWHDNNSNNNNNNNNNDNIMII